MEDGGEGEMGGGGDGRRGRWEDGERGGGREGRRERGEEGERGGGRDGHTYVRDKLTHPHTHTSTTAHPHTLTPTPPLLLTHTPSHPPLHYCLPTHCHPHALTPTPPLLLIHTLTQYGFSLNSPLSTPNPTNSTAAQRRVRGRRHRMALSSPVCMQHG